MFFKDPENNALEFKAFKDHGAIICKIMQLKETHIAPRTENYLFVFKNTGWVFLKQFPQNQGLKKAIKKKLFLLMEF